MKILPVFVEVTLIGFLTILGSPNCMAVANDSVTNNPFADIAERNVFRLKSPRNDVKQDEPPKAPVNITLTGVEKHGAEPTRGLMAEARKDARQAGRDYNMGVG